MTDPDPPSPSISLSERLARLFGPEIEPHISLVSTGEHRPGAEAVAALLRRGGALERYEVLGEIDRGGMGQVLEVYDRDLRRPLAMKVVLEDAAGPSMDGRRVARFLEEAQITAQLDHPGVVPVHELGLAPDGRVYFTMRCVRGRDLREVLHYVHYGLDGWSETRALTVILRVCEAVAFAHSRGVIHRDLKPANVMVGAFGEVYVMDWGLARVLGREATPAEPAEDPDDSVSTLLRDERSRSPASPLVTSRGDVLGTPAYMPPEQARAQLGELSPRADVYAIGAMLYHLLGHEPPYFPSGAPTTQVAALEALRQGPPRPLEEVRGGIAPELLAICERAMAFDAAQRYPDVRALADDLRAFLEQRVVSAYRTGPWAESRQWVRRNRSLAGALAATVLALLVGVVATGTQYLRAEEGATLARASERTAKDETEKVLRLADAKRLEQLELQADELWPAVTANVEALGAWLERARALDARIGLHRERLEALRLQALPYDDEAREQDRAEHPNAPELLALRADIAALLTSRPTLEGDALERLQRRLAGLEARALELERTLDARVTWSFQDVELQWQHDVLAALVLGLERLEDPDTGTLAEVEARLEFASRLEERSLGGALAAGLWEAAIEGIADARPYGGLLLAPQLGLLPLGPDPASGLWEFAHLASGEPAVRGEDGRLALSEATGVVLVLLPAGTFAMGAQGRAPGGPNYDPDSVKGEETPVREVELAPFFLSKYELTQAQWLRAAASNPSLYGPHQYSTGWNRAGLEASLLHPVEQVSWTDCARILPRLDLWMPTEAQWEYGARAGTHSVWWTGEEVTSLQGAANLADRFGTENGGVWPAYEEELDDGYTTHAPVGSLRPNAFGLHDTAGNVFEWCGDGFGPYGATPRAVDGARASVMPDAHPRRGGAWSLTAYDARSACRNPGHASFVSDALGVRPARALR